MASFFVKPQCSGPFTTLPSLVKVAFQVTPGAFADEGIAVEYVMHSTRAQFPNAPQPPALSDDESGGSDPKPPALSPRTRSNDLVVDRYPDAKPGLTMSITRALRIEQSPQPSPGIATVTVTVSDLRTGGVPSGVVADVVTVSS